MFAPDSIKFLLVLAVLFSSCGWRGGAKSENTSSAAAFAAEELKSGVPFSTVEPESFQAEFVVDTAGAENKTFVARAGNRRRFDYDSGEKNQFAVLQTSANKRFLLFPRDKIYAEDFAAGANAAAESSPDFFTSELLNQQPDAKFVRVSSENNLTKYAVRLDDSDAAETIIFVDERIGLPVRQEFYGTKGEQKILTYTIEMRNFKAQADENSFEIPRDFRKVSIETLRAAVREAKTDGE